MTEPPRYVAKVTKDGPLEQRPCRVCGEYLTPEGVTCKRCLASLEYDRLERESNR